MSLTCVSLASEPDSPKNTRPASKGTISFSFSASSTLGSWVLPANNWEYESRRSCSAATFANSSSP